MSDRARIAITTASALALAVTALGYQWAPDDPGALAHQIWGFGFLAALGLALVGVFVVYRWWSLLPALSTAVVFVVGAAVHQPEEPWSSEALPLSPELLAGLLIMITGVFVVFLSLGLLARAIWDWWRLRRASRTIATGGAR